MPNLFLTSKCNLNCSYCFASEFVNKEYSEFSFENFLNVVNLFKRDGYKKIGLIGGEPTLYTHFHDVLSFLKTEECFEEILIFTNGIEIDNFIDDILDKKFYLLINANSPKQLGVQYKKLCKNIALLKEKNVDFVLGINIYEENMDYSYIFDLIKISGHPEIRFSMSISNDKKESSENILDDFIKIKPTIISFLKDCLKNKVVPYFDCCSIPDCILTSEDRRLMVNLASLASELNFPLNPVNTCLTCKPILDIFPDMTVGRCFGLSKYYRVPLSNFKSLAMLSEYFFNSVDLYARLSYVRKECENCKFRLLGRCGVCFAFKLKQIEAIKKVAVKKCFN